MWWTQVKRHTQSLSGTRICIVYHEDVIKWKYFPRYWPFVRGIHRSPVNSPHKGQWRRALMFSFICAWINGWVNNREVGDLRRHRAHYDVTVMAYKIGPLVRNTTNNNPHHSVCVCVCVWILWMCCLTHCGLGCHIATYIWINIGSGNGVFSDDTSSLSLSILTGLDL